MLRMNYTNSVNLQRSLHKFIQLFISQKKLFSFEHVKIGQILVY